MRHCEDFELQLDELLDGTLESVAARAVEGHLAECGDCTRLYDELCELRRRAADLPTEVMPERDLWPSIDSRLRNCPATNPVPLGVGSRTRRALLAVAATAAVAVVAALVGYGLGWQRASEPIDIAAAGQNRDVVQVVAGSPGALVINDLQRARDDLMTLLHARREALSPETWKVVVDNIEVIDDAIGRIAVAIENDPENAELTRLLVAAYQRQLTLLRQAANLPAEA